jgi:DNA-binding response OmpR family regulator
MRNAAGPAIGVKGRLVMDCRQKVLVVDDEPVVCDVISACFEDWPGIEVDCVSRASPAVEKIRGGGYALALIDTLLADIPGVRLAELAINENIPVLLLSGHPRETARLEAADFPHLSKPFPMADLISESRNAIAAARANIERVRQSLELLKAQAASVRATMDVSWALVEDAAARRRDYSEI